MILISQAIMYNDNIMNIKTYLKGVQQELKQVTWPSKQQTQRMTLIVIISSLVVGLFIASLDYIFTQLIGLLIR